MKKNILVIILACIAFVASYAVNLQPVNKELVNQTTYADNILPLIQLKCGPCYLRSKGGIKTNFENYKTAKKNGAAMLERIQLPTGKKKYMPFKNPRLSEEEIAVFKKWVDDGLPEN
jgi:hypothetical protein